MSASLRPRRRVFGNRLYTHRTQAQCSQERMAEILSIAVRTYVRWEHGETTPSPRRQQDVARRLGWG